MTSLYLVAVFALLFAWKKTRDFAICFLPWLIYAVAYDSMRFYPNYLVNAIDTGNLYDAEKGYFGITANGLAEIRKAAETCIGSSEAIWESGTLIPGEWFAIHHVAWADFLAGVFYLCWIPVPAMFAVYLYFKGEKEWMRRFSWAFLIVNLIGFVGYYVHPASPPWYVMKYGFNAVVGTPGNLAGLERFDAMTGLNVFHGLYSANANVFAAVPSLHAAYLPVAMMYAIMSKRRYYTVLLFAFLSLGIWFTAVYSGHHYIIDVILGIITAFVGVAAFEIGWRRFHKKSSNTIKE